MTATTTPRIAGAPISWGISEVPDWGFQLPVDRVLSEMRELGYSASEIGPDGFLPPDPAEKAAVLGRYGLAAVGSFVPVVVHKRDVDPLPRILRELDDYAPAGARTLIVAAVTGERGYDATRVPLTDDEWSTLFANLARIDAAATERGVQASLHPHVGTVIETREDVQRLIDDSDFRVCFDTGHLMIGGTDPVAFAQQHAHRVAVVHLKDVSLAGMQRVKNGEISYFDAIVRDELYRPLGQGDVDVRAIITALVRSGFDGWFVLEQDKVVREDPAPGDGPIRDARASVTFLNAVLADLRNEV